MSIYQGLAGLQFDVDLDDDEMVTDAIILARVTRVTRMSDGRFRFSFVLARSQGSDVVTTTGLMHCGLEIHSASEWTQVDEDDDE